MASERLITARVGAPVPAPARALREAPGRLGALAAASAAAVAVGLLVAYGYSEVAFVVAAALPAVALVIRYPFAGILIWLLVMPFFVRQLTADASLAHWVVHRLGLPALLVLLVVLDLLGLRRRFFRLQLVDVLLALFLVAGVLNVLAFSPNPIRMTISFYDKLALPIVVFWIIRAISPDRQALGHLVWVGAWTIAAQVAIGVLTWFAPELVPAQWLGRAGERTVGTLGGPGPYTITLVFFALLTIYWLLGTERARGLQRAVLSAAVVGALLAVFLSLSRGSWLGAGLAFAGLGFVYPRYVMRLGFAALAVLVIAFSAGVLRDQTLYAQERLEDVATVESRIVTNDAALRMVAERPIAGFGYGNFERFDESYKQRVGEIPLKLGGSAHNTYLNMAVELGLPALLLYLGVPFWLLVRTISLRTALARADPSARQLVAVLWLAALDQFVVSNFLEMIHPNLWGTVLWWLTLGLICVTLDRVSGATRSGTAGRTALAT